MTSRRKEIAKQLIINAGQGIFDKVEPLLAPDFTLEQMEHDPENVTTARGMQFNRETYLEFLHAIAKMTQNGLNLKVDLMVEEGDHVVAFGTSDALSPSGWPYKNAYCWHLTFRGEQITSLTDYYDTVLGRRLIAG